MLLLIFDGIFSLHYIQHTIILTIRKLSLTVVALDCIYSRFSCASYNVSILRKHLTSFLKPVYSQIASGWQTSVQKFIISLATFSLYFVLITRVTYIQLIFDYNQKALFKSILSKFWSHMVDFLKKKTSYFNFFKL